MDLDLFQICFIVAALIGIVLALAASQSRPSYLREQERIREGQREFAIKCRNDPAWPAKVKFSKDTAKLRHDSAYEQPDSSVPVQRLAA